MRPPRSRTRPRTRAALAATLSLASLLAAARVRGQAPPPGPAAPAPAPPAATKKAGDPNINREFANPDVKAFVSGFESDNREVYAKREAIVRALDLKPGMAVADIGAGTGLFTRLIADRVGPQGVVYAVDVAPAFLKHIEDQSGRLGQDQVRVVLGTQKSTGLAVGSIDLAFLCDAYHHLEHPEQTLRSIHRAIRPGGQLVVIDFDRVKGKSSELVLKHVRAERSVFESEIKAAGFEPVPAAHAPALKENFFLRFRRPNDPPRPPQGPVGG